MTALIEAHPCTFALPQKFHGGKTKVMASGLRTKAEALALAGCDFLVVVSGAHCSCSTGQNCAGGWVACACCAGQGSLIIYRWVVGGLQHGGGCSTGLRC